MKGANKKGVDRFIGSYFTRKWQRKDDFTWRTPLANILRQGKQKITLHRIKRFGLNRFAPIVRFNAISFFLAGERLQIFLGMCELSFYHWVVFRCVLFLVFARARSTSLMPFVFGEGENMRKRSVVLDHRGMLLRTTMHVRCRTAFPVMKSTYPTLGGMGGR